MSGHSSQERSGSMHQGDEAAAFGDRAEKAPRYRKLAADARAKAERISFQQAKQILLDVAERYERLADTVDANARRARR
jgi:hypothetical protein